jgi:hypothetical protein
VQRAIKRAFAASGADVLTSSEIHPRQIRGRPSATRRPRCAHTLLGILTCASAQAAPQHISSGLPPTATVNADIRNRRSVASDQ